MIDALKDAQTQFEKHVPYASAAFLILKAHLVLEARLLEFLKARISPKLFDQVEKQRDFTFYVRVLLAQALAERDDIPPDNAEILWPALQQLGALRNSAAHVLEHEGTSLEDKMRAFVKKVDPSGELFGMVVSEQDLHHTFRDAASYLNSLFAIHREPLLIADELVHPPEA